MIVALPGLFSYLFWKQLSKKWKKLRNKNCLMALFRSPELWHVIHSIANRDAVLGHGDLSHNLSNQGHLLARRNTPTKFEGPRAKHCRVIGLFCTRSL